MRSLIAGVAVAALLGLSIARPNSKVGVNVR